MISWVEVLSWSSLLSLDFTYWLVLRISYGIIRYKIYTIHHYTDYTTIDIYTMHISVCWKITSTTIFLVGKRSRSAGVASAYLIVFKKLISMQDVVCCIWIWCQRWHAWCWVQFLHDINRRPLRSYWLIGWDSAAGMDEKSKKKVTREAEFMGIMGNPEGP